MEGGRISGEGRSSGGWSRCDMYVCLFPKINENHNSVNMSMYFSRFHTSMLTAPFMIQLNIAEVVCRIKRLLSETVHFEGLGIIPFLKQNK